MKDHQSFPDRDSDRSLNTRATLLKTLAAAGTLAGIALSPKLWISSRAYPLSPVITTLPTLRYPCDVFLIGSLVVTLIALLFARRPGGPTLLALFLGTLLVFLDQSRLQPWFLQYLLTLSALALFYRSSSGSSFSAVRREAALNACRALIASMYFWSGVQKLNPQFTNAMFPWMVDPLLNRLPSVADSWLLRSGGLVPLIEIGIGLALLSVRAREVAVCAAVFTHCFLLFVLGPFGHNSNSVVWPWNAVMMATVVTLFWRTSQVSAREITFAKGPVLQRSIVLLVVIAPALNFFGYWDTYPAWALYSANKSEAVLHISDNLLERLPEPVQQHVYEAKQGGMLTLDLYEWSASELNVPVYPEPRIYANIARALCRFSTAPNDIALTVLKKATWPRGTRARLEYGCPARAK